MCWKVSPNVLECLLFLLKGRHRDSALGGCGWRSWEAPREASRHPSLLAAQAALARGVCVQAVGPQPNVSHQRELGRWCQGAQLPRARGASCPMGSGLLAEPEGPGRGRWRRAHVPWAGAGHPSLAGREGACLALHRPPSTSAKGRTPRAGAQEQVEHHRRSRGSGPGALSCWCGPGEKGTRREAGAGGRAGDRESAVPGLGSGAGLSSADSGARAAGAGKAESGGARAAPPTPGEQQVVRAELRGHGGGGGNTPVRGPRGCGMWRQAAGDGKLRQGPATETLRRGAGLPSTPSPPGWTGSGG